MNKIYAAGGAVLIVAVWFGVSWHAKTNHKAGYEAAVAEYTIKIAEINEESRKREIKLQENADDWEKKHADLVSAAVSTATALDGALNSLRDDLYAANREAEYEATRSGRAMDENARLATELRDVVALCATEYSALAKKAESLRVNLIGLQGWVGVVLAENEKP